MITSPIPPVVPAGHLAHLKQPVLPLPNGHALRPWHVNDAPALIAAVQEPPIRQWNRLVVTSEAEARKRIERMHDRWQNEQAAVWAIARPDDGQAVGLIGWGDIDLEGGNAEILFWILSTERGRGTAVEATKSVTTWAFDELGLHRLRLCHAVANAASCRVATKAGFTWEGTMRSALLHEDGWHDEHLHAMIRGDL